MKKSISVILVCIMLLSMFAIGASAEESAWPEYVSYTIKDGEAEITRCNCGFTFYRNLVIPETVEGCPVTSIKNSAFDSCVYHDTIQLPSTIEKIGIKGLNGSFKKISIDENNAYFSSDDYGTLYNKDKTELVQYPIGRAETSYTVPDSVEIIGLSAFYRSKLSEIVFPDNLKTIKQAAFCYSHNLSTVNIPDSVEVIDGYAFADCHGLKEINLGAGVSTIGFNAFNSDIEKVNVSEDNQSFCSDDNGVVYTKDMKDLYYYPIGKTDEKFVVPEGVVNLGTKPFSSKYIKEIVLSSTVESTDQVFDYCQAIERISVVEDSAFFSNDEFGILYNKDKTELVRCPTNINTTAVVVPKNVTNLSKYAFYNCKYLESICLSPNITNISQFALRNCTKLKYLYIPAGVTSFGEQSFLGTTNVTDIYYYGTQEQWNSLRGKNYIQNGILNTATVHFNFGQTSGVCGEGVSWSFDEDNGHLKISGNGEIEEKTSFDDYGWYNFKDEITYVEIALGVTNVPKFAFEGCTELIEVYLSESVSLIGENAFNGCDKLKVVSSTYDNSISLGENSIPENENITVVCKKANTSLSSLSYANSVLVSFDEEEKILHFEGDITVYSDMECNFLNKFMSERTDSEYILFDKVVFDGVSPDFIESSEFESAESGVTNLTLTNLYVSLKVVQGDSERTITFEEMLKLLEEGDFDAFKYVIESEEESGEKTFLIKVGEYIVEIAERALRAISSVINFIAKLFK